jgi:hypothetical protein
MSSFEILKFDDAYIELIEEFPCENVQQLQKKEGECIRLHRDVCVNIVIPGRTLQESRKAYKEAHREDIIAKKKTYRETHREQVRTHDKTYREAHKEEIIAKQKAWYQANKAKKALATDP